MESVAQMRWPIATSSSSAIFHSISWHGVSKRSEGIVALLDNEENCAVRATIIQTVLFQKKLALLRCCPAPHVGFCPGLRRLWRPRYSVRTRARAKCFAGESLFPRRRDRHSGAQDNATLSSPQESPHVFSGRLDRRNGGGGTVGICALQAVVSCRNRQRDAGKGEDPTRMNIVTSITYEDPAENRDERHGIA